ncbi:hypothetical protein A1A1_07539 [Planococcus antarcticus DSM 14505]|uniref:DUF3784 domain-containing protein n=1 Tax=Planococcus antarcticus DSM 14505 TaxID=1185653 RepID=A0AA87LSG0_9BACL|nr:hypothetical protein A1A1_07539 [Planococcus antarcticus DSM 14505]
MTIEMLIPLALMFLFLIMSLILLQGKGAILIVGYNTMPAEEKAKYDAVALCKATEQILLIVTFSIGFIFMGVILQLHWLVNIGIFIMVASIAIALVDMNTGNRYKKSNGS